MDAAFDYSGNKRNTISGRSGAYSFDKTWILNTRGETTVKRQANMIHIRRRK